MRHGSRHLTVRRGRLLAAATLACVLGEGCSSRSVGAGAPSDAGPGEPDGAAHLDATVSPGACDGVECVVALPASCCWGCPQVVSREELAQLECFFEEGHPPDTIPEECDLDCLWCPDCVPRPLGARCEAGACVPTDMGCADFLDEVTAVGTHELVQNTEAHAGVLRQVRGVVLPGEGSCDGEMGCTADYVSLLDGVVPLTGYQCDLTVDLTGHECRAGLIGHALTPGGWYELQGVAYPHPTPLEVPWLEVSGFRLVPPENEGGHYEVTVTEVLQMDDCFPTSWTEGETFDVYLARFGDQVVVASPALHCESNFSGRIDDLNPLRFTSFLPADCCDLGVSGLVGDDRLEGTYQSPCYLLQFEGTRSPWP